jgi:hypothetical protein
MTPRETRLAYKERMRRQWEAREAKRPPMVERMSKAFKEFYGGRAVFMKMSGRARRAWRGLIGPEGRAHEDALNAEVNARLPRLVLQDDAWRKRFA